MDAGVRRCVAEHRPPGGWRVALDVEATWREVVDVEHVKGVQGVKDTSQAFDQCVIEAAWAVDLTWNFDVERRTHRVTLSAAPG